MIKEGIVFDIQKYCIHDGPGIRTLVFLKGCDLNCPWCSNPESQRFKPELFFNPERCIGCRACLEVCPNGAVSVSNGKLLFHRDLCRGCLSCTEVCYVEARVAKGRRMGVDEVVEEVVKDEVFYRNSGGGVTLSGGEPLAQADFAAAILRQCKERGLHTAVETAGHKGWSQMKKIIPYTDLFLYDLKHMDPDIHRRHIGADNRLILANLERLSGGATQIIVRTPIIPGFNDASGEVRAIACHVAALGIPELHLLPYHPYGRGKYRLLGRDFPLEGKKELENHRIEALRAVAACQGLKVQVGG